MRISKPLAIVIAVFTIWPLVYFALFMGTALIESAALASSEEMPIFGSFGNFFAVHSLTMLVMLGLATLYIVHAFKNEALASDKRVLWVIVLLFGGFVAGPIYWFYYIWRTPEAIPQQGSG